MNSIIGFVLRVASHIQHHFINMIILVQGNVYVVNEKNKYDIYRWLVNQSLTLSRRRIDSGIYESIIDDNMVNYRAYNYMSRFLAAHCKMIMFY